MGKLLHLPNSSANRAPEDHAEKVVPAEEPTIKTTEDLLLHCLESFDKTVKVVGVVVVGTAIIK